MQDQQDRASYHPGLRGRVRRFFDQWLFQLRAPESGEVFLHHRRVFIVPTRAGFGFAAMLLVLFIASVNYTLSLGFALTFLIAGCALVDLHLTYRNLAYLSLSAGRAQPVFAGQEAQFGLDLINRRKYGRYAIWLGFQQPGQDHPEHPADIAADSTESVTLAIPAERRGWLHAPRVRLQTRFPLGLLRAWSYWHPDLQVLVYPHPETEAPPLPMGGGSGKESNGSRAGQEDFGGVRSYQAGDPMKHLAWRQIAKVDLELGGQLVSKHFEGGGGGELCLDFASLPPGMDLESRLSRMARWVLDAEQQGLPYSFRLGGKEFPAALGTAHQAACLRELALHP